MGQRWPLRSSRAICGVLVGRRADVSPPWTFPAGNPRGSRLHRIGLLHVAVLFANPRQEIDAVDLVAGVAALGNAATSESTQPVLDGAAHRQYRLAPPLRGNQSGAPTGAHRPGPRRTRLAHRRTRRRHRARGTDPPIYRRQGTRRHRGRQVHPPYAPAHRRGRCHDRRTPTPPSAHRRQMLVLARLRPFGGQNLPGSASAGRFREPRRGVAGPARSDCYRMEMAGLPIASPGAIVNAQEVAVSVAPFAGEQAEPWNSAVLPPSTWIVTADP